MTVDKVDIREYFLVSQDDRRYGHAFYKMCGEDGDKCTWVVSGEREGELLREIVGLNPNSSTIVFENCFAANGGICAVSEYREISQSAMEFGQEKRKIEVHLLAPDGKQIIASMSRETFEEQIEDDCYTDGTTIGWLYPDKKESSGLGIMHYLDKLAGLFDPIGSVFESIF